MAAMFFLDGWDKNLNVSYVFIQNVHFRLCKKTKTPLLHAEYSGSPSSAPTCSAPLQHFFALSRVNEGAVTLSNMEEKCTGLS